MKKFILFPLFIAVSGCTNNISYKNVPGDKFLIRVDTVKVEKLTREDFKFANEPNVSKSASLYKKSASSTEIRSLLEILDFIDSIIIFLKFYFIIHLFKDVDCFFFNISNSI